MRAVIRSLILPFIILLTHSCIKGIRLEKRHYRQGFYFHKQDKRSGSHHHIPRERKRQIPFASTESSEPDLELPTRPANNGHFERHRSLFQFRNTFKTRPNVTDVNERPSVTLKKHHRTDEAKPLTPVEKARKRSSVYFWTGLGLLVLTFSGVIGDFVLLTFPLALFFLILALINLHRKRRYRRLEKHPEEIKPQKSTEQKTKNSRTWFYATALLSVILLVAALMNANFFYLFALSLIPTLILFFRWKKMYIHQQEKKPLPEKRSELDDPEKAEARRAAVFAWAAVFCLLVLLAAILLGFYGFVIYTIEQTGVQLVLMIVGTVIAVLAAILFERVGALAAESGKEIQRRHANETFYRHKATAVFSRCMGALAGSTWLVALGALLIYVLIGLSLL